MTENYLFKNGISFNKIENKKDEEIYFEIYFNGSKAGMAKLCKDPIGMVDYYLGDFYIYEDSKFRDKKLGSNLIEQVNFFLRTNGYSAKLIDNIVGDKEGLYERHGWCKKTDDIFLYFNYEK